MLSICAQHILYIYGMCPLFDPEFCENLVAAKPLSYPARDHIIAVRPNGAFPHYGDTPSKFAQLCLVPSVARYVGIKFGSPFAGHVVRVCAERAAFVTMPEAAVDFDRGIPPWKDNVRGAGQVPSMLSEPKADAVQRTSKPLFETGILAADSGHHFRTGRLVDNVDHDFSPGYARGTWYWSQGGETSPNDP